MDVIHHMDICNCFSKLSSKRSRYRKTDKIALFGRGVKTRIRWLHNYTGMLTIGSTDKEVVQYLWHYLFAEAFPRPCYIRKFL